MREMATPSTRREALARVQAMAGVQRAADRWLWDAVFVAIDAGVPYRALGHALNVSPTTIANRHTRHVSGQNRR